MDYNDVKVGMLITAYQKGFHIVQSKRRGGSNGLVDMVRVVSEKGERAPKSSSCCDVAYCKEVTQADIDKMYNDRISLANKLRDNLTSFLPEGQT